jgi:hypothetical protein
VKKSQRKVVEYVGIHGNHAICNEKVKVLQGGQWSVAERSLEVMCIVLRGWDRLKAGLRTESTKVTIISLISI